MLSYTTSLCCNLPSMYQKHSAQDKRADRYQKQCRIHGQPIQHRTNEPIGTRNSVGYMVNPCSTGNCCLHTMFQVPKKCMKCYVVCKICILQLKKYRKFYFSSSDGAIGMHLLWGDFMVTTPFDTHFLALYSSYRASPPPPPPPLPLSPDLPMMPCIMQVNATL